MVKRFLIVLLVLVTAQCVKNKRTEPKQKNCTFKNVQVKRSFLKTISYIRKQKGLLEITEDPALKMAAFQHAGRLAETKTLFHRDKLGGPLERLNRMGVNRVYVSENIARIGPAADPGQAALAYWKGRKKEYENLISPLYLRMGASMVPRGNYCYCVLIMSN